MESSKRRSSVKKNSPKATPDEVYTLPDGNIFKIGIERHICGEMMFKPSLVATLSSRLEELRRVPGQTRLRQEQLARDQHDPLHQLVASSISSCSSSMRKDLVRNIFVSGGCAEMTGLSSRLKRELSSVLRNAKIDVVTTKPDVTSRVSSQTDAWRGGSMFASLSTFSSACLSRKDYDEIGSDGLLRFSF
jgi:actin-related protein